MIMEQIAENLQKIKSQLLDNVKLVAVSKVKPNEDIMAAYHAGQRLFGENYVQELAQKYESLPKDIQWHFIGHLQTNKVKYIIPFVSCIQSIDTPKLLSEVNRLAAKYNRTVDVLLQFHIAEESTKFGFSIEEVKEMLQLHPLAEFPNVRICGVMGMGTFTEDMTQVRREFKTLKSYFDELKATYFEHADYFKEISMGMTDDYLIAQQEGATIVRIGSAIFGKRIYNKQ